MHESSSAVQEIDTAPIFSTLAHSVRSVETRVAYNAARISDSTKAATRRTIEKLTGQKLAAPPKPVAEAPKKKARKEETQDGESEEGEED